MRDAALWDALVRHPGRCQAATQPSPRPPRAWQQRRPSPRWRPHYHQDGGRALTKMAEGALPPLPEAHGQVVPSRPSMAEASGEGPRLPELLETGWRLLEEVEASTEPSSGAPSVQAKVRQGLGALQRAAAMVEELELFR